MKIKRKNEQEQLYRRFICEDVIVVHNICLIRTKTTPPPDTTVINHIIAYRGQNMMKCGIYLESIDSMC